MGARPGRRRETLRQATGWHEITNTARPDDTDTTTHDRTIELVAGVPTVVWTERDLSHTAPTSTSPPPRSR